MMSTVVRDNFKPSRDQKVAGFYSAIFYSKNEKKFGLYEISCIFVVAMVDVT